MNYKKKKKICRKNTVHRALYNIRVCHVCVYIPIYKSMNIILAYQVHAETVVLTTIKLHSILAYRILSRGKSLQYYVRENE